MRIRRSTGPVAPSAMLAALLLVIPIHGCEGPAGPEGKAGAAGVAGADGKDGVAGKDGVGGKDGVDGKDGTGGTALAYVGSARCADCHAAHAAQVAKMGHNYKLTKVVNGQKVTRPFDAVTGGVPDPPLGMTWNDVSYVIGGFAWKARYVDKQGYVVTGEASDTTQWLFPNAELGTSGKWAAYNAGKKTPYDCGTCHTTGWVPCPEGDQSCKRQDDMPGMLGSFAEEGVRCEACHGPGSQHAASPYLVKPQIDRSPELCGKCHIRGDVESVNAKGGFIEHHEQYEELFASKKHSMRCVDCHNPHKSVKFKDPTVNPTGGIRIGCTTCHVGYDKRQKSAAMAAMVSCADCHMAKIGKSAVGDAAKFTGDIRTHFFAINTDGTAPQFSADGLVANPYVSLDWACKSCHRAGGKASLQTDDALSAEAIGYHQP